MDTSMLSNKLKDYLTRKLEELNAKIAKVKKKRKIIKILYYTITILSITISAILASVSLAAAVPAFAITVLSTTSAILTAISTKFDFQTKTIEIEKDSQKLNKLNNKLDYVISCNGNLSPEEYKDIMNEFN